MVLCLLSRDSHGDTGKLNHEEMVRGPEIAIFPGKSEILLLGSEDLHFSPASFSAQNFGKFSSDHHETPSSSIVANKDDLESRDNVLEKSLRSNVAKFRFT